MQNPCSSQAQQLHLLHLLLRQGPRRLRHRPLHPLQFTTFFLLLLADDYRTA